MKKTTYLFILAFIFISFSSCVENEISFSNSNNSQSKSSFQVTIDGVLFSTESVDYTSDGVDIAINAIKQGTDEIITLKINNFGLGNFSFDGASNVASYIKNDSFSANIWSTFNATSSKGNIQFTTIDNVNNTVSGTFNFSGENLVAGSTKEFVSGSFTNIPKSVLPVSNNTFFAKLDGVEYKEISLFGSAVTIGGNDLILINANKSLSETISFSLNSDIAVGEYEFGSFITQSYPTGQYTVGGGVYVADGKITITKHDIKTKLISGTFEFDASPITTTSPNFAITEGSFSISY